VTNPDPNTTPYYQLPLLGFDTETDGVDVKNSHVITCNITYSFLDGTYQKNDWLLKPIVEIPQGASDVHGITTVYATENGMDPKEALQHIHDHLYSWESYGLPLVAFNAQYDCSLLHYEWIRHGIERKVKFNRVIDPFVLDKKVHPYRKKGTGTLTALAQYYMVDLDNAHSADADVMATLGIARHMPHAFEREKLDLMQPVDKLHELQVQLKSEQAASFQKYLREKKGEKDAIINGEWPVIYGETGN